MKIFPIKLMSKFDILLNLCKVMDMQKAAKITSEPDMAIINGTIKTLKKGRNICDKLSE